jgi:hypothetical protein
MRSDTVMTYKGFHAQIMETQRLKGDQVFGLPPGSALEVYPADAFVEYPENWLKGPGVFVVPVRPDKGLWFNWNMNDSANTAVLPTVKGCNPITGMQTSGFHLERYDTKCPKHGVDFKGDRYCPECDYKWPFGNYVASPNVLWWDGFANTKDGTVRQFFFTEEEMRDIASKMIGKENTVPAFGFAFYKPKEPRPTKVNFYRGSHCGESAFQKSLLYGELSSKSFGTGQPDVSYTYTNSTGPVLGDVFTKGSLSAQNCAGDQPIAMYASAASPAAEFSNLMDVDCERSLGGEKQLHDRLADFKASKSVRTKRTIASGSDASAQYRDVQPVKEVSIGAGAKIAQNLQPDPYALDTWCDKPEAVMTVYFVFEEKFEELKAGGLRDLEGKPEGMLAGMPVG